MSTATELALELADIRSEIAALRLREMDIQERLAAEMETDRLELSGVGVFERHRKADRKAWNHDGVRSALIVAAKDTSPHIDLATGEIEGDWERAFRVMNECALPSWRVRALRTYDINADEYCEVKRGGYSIQIVS